MSDVFSWISERIWAILMGVIIGLIIDFIIKFIPIGENIRFKAVFYRRKLAKWIFNTPIRVSYTVKSSNLEGKGIYLSDFISQSRQRLIQNSFEFVGERGYSSIFKYIVGKTEMEITLTPSYFPQNENKDLVISYVQCDFKLIECGYRKLEGHMLDLMRALIKLKDSLREIIGELTNDSLSCEIKRLYEFTGVLKDLKMSSLTGKICGLYKIDLSENKLVIYGPLDQELVSIIKDIIAYYY